jgi:polysaccharide deacetylase 2 family uncharacterized protein YibQ
LTGSSRGRFAGVLALGCLLAPTVTALGQPARVAVIIDDLGNARTDADRTANLPGAITCSVLPHTPYAGLVAETCRNSGKEVFVHLPMQPDDPAARLGPGALRIGQTREQLRAILAADLDTVPGAVGVNNHMGSLLTRHITYMDWLMGELATRDGLLFVDSATTAQSVALRLAADHGLPTTRRDVFLDEDRSPNAIRRQWARLVEVARARGTALAIGHPHEFTLDVLLDEIEAAASRDIMLVSVTELVRIRGKGGQQSWQRFSSR